jgi:zinc protease
MNRNRGRALLLFLVTWSPILWAGPEIQTWQTPNGAKVLFVAAPEIPMVDAQVIFDAGSARDGDKPGLTSLTNGLLTEGAGAWNADQIAQRLEGVGAELDSGALRDMAWVSVRSLTEQPALDTALETLAAIISRPRFDPEDVERLRQQMQVSLRRSEQNPGSVAKKAFYRQVYGDHPYGADSGGTEESLAALSREDLVAAYQRYYVAANAVVAIVGAVEQEQAKKIAAQLTAGLPRGEPAPALPEVAGLGSAVLHQRVFPSSQTHLYVGQPGMRRNDPDYFSLYVGNHILGGNGLVSQLSEEVRENRGLSYSVYSYFLPMRELGPFMIGAQTKNASAEEALGAMREVVQRFIEQGPTAEELRAAKRNITGGFPLRIASNNKILSYLAVIGFYDMPLDHLDTFNAKVEAVTAEQIRDAFRRRLDLDRLVTVVVGGEATPVATPVSTPATAQQR